MYDFFALISIFIIGMGLCRLLRCKLGKAIPLAIMLIISILFVSGCIVNSLDIGFKLIVFFLIVLSIVILKDLKKINVLMDLHIYIYMFVALIIFVIHHKYSMATKWDELAQWAVTVKYSYLTNFFAANKLSNSLYKDYPPATALFHYYWMRIGNGWSDHRLYVSMCVLIVSFLLPFISKFNEIAMLQKKEILCNILLDIGITVIPLAIYPNLYCSLTVDGFMGILFGYMLYNIFLETDNNIRHISIAIGCFVITSTKNSGLIFSLFVLVVYLLKVFLDEKKELLYWFFAVLCCAVGKGLWSCYIIIHGVDKTFSMGTSIDYLKTLQDWQIQGFNNYYRALIDYSIAGNDAHTTLHISAIKVPIGLWILFLLIGAVFIYKKNESVFIKTSFIILLIGLLIYIVCTSYLYIRSFGEAEVNVLSSMSRYLGTYILGLFLIEIMVVLLYYNNWKVLVLVGTLLIVIAHYDGNKIITHSFIDSRDINKTMSMHEKYDDRAMFIKRTIDNDLARLHVFNDEMALLNYLLTPMCVKTPVWAVDEFEYFDDLCHEYDYVWVGDYRKLDIDVFKDKYGHFFADEDEISVLALYKIEYNNETPILRLVKKMSN